MANDLSASGSQPCPQTGSNPIVFGVAIASVRIIGLPAYELNPGISTPVAAWEGYRLQFFRWGERRLGSCKVSFSVDLRLASFSVH